MFKHLVLAAGLGLMLTGCAFHGLVSAGAEHQTQVELNKSNFRVIGPVSGSASVLKVFGLGGFSSQGLIQQAKDQMQAQAEMAGKPRAIVNQHVEVQSRIILFVSTKKVTVSGQVIEFTN